MNAPFAADNLDSIKFAIGQPVPRQEDPTLLQGQGDGTFRQVFVTEIRGSPISVAVADLNGDGKPDMVVSGSSNDKLTVYLGHGDGTFEPPAAYPVGSGPGVVVAPAALMAALAPRLA